MKSPSRLQPRGRVVTASLVLALLSAFRSAHAADLYWDINAGNWNGATANWNENAAGGGATRAATTSSDNIFFSAGTGHSGTFSVTASSTQSANSLTFEEGTVTVTGGTIAFGSGTSEISVASGRTATISSLLTGANGLTKTGAGNLVFGAVYNSGLTGAISVKAGALAAGSSASSQNSTNGQTISLGDTTGTASATFSVNRNQNYNSNVIVNAGSTGVKRLSGGPGLTAQQTPSITGTVTLNDDVTLGNGTGGVYTGNNYGGIRLSGVITGGKKITVEGTNAFTNPTDYTTNSMNATLATTAAQISGASGASFTGNVAIERGSLVIQNAGAIGNGTAVVSTASGAVLDLRNASISIAGLANGTTTGGSVANLGVITNVTGPVYSSSGNAILSLKGAGSYSYGGVIQDGSNAGNVWTTALTVDMGAGTQTLTGANTYTGATTITSGTLALGATNAFSGASAYVLNGGTINAGAFTATLGTLDLNASSTITLGSGGALAFAASNSADWGAFELSVGGSFVSGGSLRFGSDNTGLTPTQLALINIAGFGSIGLDGSGFLTASAIPEPGSFAALAGLAGLGLAALRRRRRD